MPEETSERLLANLVGTPLSAAEANALFDRIVEEVDASAAIRAQANSRRWLGPMLMAALVLFAMLLQQPSPYTGVKGVEVPQLLVFSVDEGGRVDAELSSPAHLSAGDSVLFRYRLTASDQVTLLAREQGRTVVAWQSSGVQPAGDHELTADGQALAWMLDGPAEFGLLLGGLDPDRILELDDLCGRGSRCTRFKVTLE